MINAKERYKLRQFVMELEKIRGRHTELVSVYVPAGYDIIKIIQHLAQEQGTASNIKDKNTRTKVIDSIEKMIQHLRLFKRTPDNGLAVFSGDASDKESKIDIRVWSIEPPEPISIRLYRCDQTFLLDPLKALVEVKEIFGLIVLDKREANIGLLKGMNITVLSSMTSGVPGKSKAGGQCVSPDTLIMLDDGNIIQIKESHNPNFVVSENLNQELTESTPIIAKWSNKKELFKIITTCPRLEIKASKEHTFFVRTDKGIEEKQLSEIKPGDYLLMPEKIDLDLEDKEINFKPNMKMKFKEVEIPKKINPHISKILGYYLGDGSYELDRLTFFEQRKNVAEYYQNLLQNIFKTKVDLRFRKDKNYYQIRIYSRVVSQFIKTLFTNKNKTLQGIIPEIILNSSDNSLASFISGFFDAEGYVSCGRVAFGINNYILAKQFQLTLLRLGIISSMQEYDNRKNPYSNKIRYTIGIDDIESLKKFSKLIGFSSIEKQNKLLKIIKNRSNKNSVRQLIVNGKDVARIIRNSGLDTTQFGNPLFFVNKRQMSKEVFKKNILNKIKDLQLRKRLEFIYKSNLIVTKIKDITTCGFSETIDIETKNHNFIANGLLVHNSQQRFARLREEAAHEFFKRIGEISNKEFMDKPEIKGILIGGPGHTKEDFVSGDYLHTELKNKILTVKDISYTDESGLHDLVDKSHDVLAEEEISIEKKLIQRFYEMLAKEEEKTTYGYKETKKALAMGVVDILLVSDTFTEEKIEDLELEADKYKTEVRIISTETREGKQLKDLGGIAAILRYPLR